MKKSTIRLIIPLAAALILSTAPDRARSQSPQHADARQAGNAEFDRHTLENYVAVSAELERIQHECAQNLRGVTDEKRAMKIEQEGARKKVSAVENGGLDLQTYNNIANQIHVDPELRREIVQLSTTRDD